MNGAESLLLLVNIYTKLLRHSAPPSSPPSSVAVQYFPDFSTLSEAQAADQVNPSDMILDDGNVIPGSLSWWLCFGVVGGMAGRAIGPEFDTKCVTEKCVCGTTAIGKRAAVERIICGRKKGGGSHFPRGGVYAVVCCPVSAARSGFLWGDFLVLPSLSCRAPRLDWGSGGGWWQCVF